MSMAGYGESDVPTAKEEVIDTNKEKESDVPAANEEVIDTNKEKESDNSSDEDESDGYESSSGSECKYANSCCQHLQRYNQCEIFSPSATTKRY